MQDMTGKTALVTGASRGIGAACARALGRAGAGVVVHYAREGKKAEAVARDLGNDGARTVRADLAEPGAARALWAEALGWRGRIDVLVNNAGIFEPAELDAPDGDWDAVWERTLQVNLTAVGDLCRAAVAAFAAQGGGVIVNVASRAAHRGDGARYWAYGATKAGVVALTKTVARNWAKDRVLAYAVAPGFTATDMADRALADADARARAVAEIPMGEMTPPEDVANVVAFLASGAAPHATGTTVDVNGASYVR